MATGTELQVASLQVYFTLATAISMYYVVPDSAWESLIACGSAYS